MTLTKEEYFAIMEDITEYGRLNARAHTRLCWAGSQAEAEKAAQERDAFYEGLCRKVCDAVYHGTEYKREVK